MLINVLENMLNLMMEVRYVAILVDIMLILMSNIVQQNVLKNMNILFQNLDNIVFQIVQLKQYII